MDGGTLYQLRNIVNRRNVGQDCSKNVNACEDFFTTVTEAHILAAAMEVFQMDSLEDRPSTDHFPSNSSHLDSLQRRQLILLGVKEVLAKFVNLPVRKIVLLMVCLTMPAVRYHSAYCIRSIWIVFVKGMVLGFSVFGTISFSYFVQQVAQIML